MRALWLSFSSIYGMPDEIRRLKVWSITFLDLLYFNASSYGSPFLSSSSFTSVSHAGILFSKSLLKVRKRLDKRFDKKSVSVKVFGKCINNVSHEAHWIHTILGREVRYQGSIKKRNTWVTKYRFINDHNKSRAIPKHFVSSVFWRKGVNIALIFRKSSLILGTLLRILSRYCLLFFALDSFKRSFMSIWSRE
jgi:hypothetical protein